MTTLYEALVALEDVVDLLENRDVDRVRLAMSRGRLGIADLALLLSPGAEPLLEEMAQKANAITRARFGNALSLYAPLYTTNACSGTCAYCGFKRSIKFGRRTLTLEEVVKEGKALRQSGIQHVLLVGGDASAGSGVPFISEAARLLKRDFPSVTVEIPPLDEMDYRTLMTAGVDGVTLYQETYDEATYETLHAGSPKADFRYRLDALARAGRVGMRKLNLGALWGLSPWRLEALKVGFHARFLEKRFWKSQILIGMPRLHNVPDDFTIPHPLDDRSFCHIMVALRIFLHDAGIVVSTRERPGFRDHLPMLGATQFSAGSKTDPGGYTAERHNGVQFEIDDTRSPLQVMRDLKACGFDPVFKDWDVGFVD